MIRVRVSLALAATVALLAASEAPAQPGSFAPTRAITPTPFAVLVLNGIDDPNIVAECGVDVKAEQFCIELQVLPQ